MDKTTWTKAFVKAMCRLGSRHCLVSLEDAAASAWLPYREFDPVLVAFFEMGKGRLDSARLAIRDSESNASARYRVSVASCPSRPARQ